MKKPMIAAQLYSVRNEMDIDLEGTLRRLKEIGFQGVEPMLMPLKKQNNYPALFWTDESRDRCFQLCKKIGLEICSVHLGIGFSSCRTPEKKTAELIRKVHQQYGVRYYIVSGMFTTETAAKSWGHYLRKLSEDLKDEGVVILYHNHDSEFYPSIKDGKKHFLMDTFFDAAGEDVKMQFDMGWAGYAYDALKLFESYQNRILSIHCKDFSEETEWKSDINQIEDRCFIPCGTGMIPVKDIVVRYLEKTEGSPLIVIEQDRCSHLIFDDLKESFDNITLFSKTDSLKE